jgi:coenzyme F420-reducing hydrogenase delta subunit
MCSGRVDLEFIFRAFLNGQDGVFIGGCKLDECNYITHGNYDALANTLLSKKLLTHIGLNPDRLRIDFMSGADGNLLVDLNNDFTRQIKTLGPLGTSEGLEENVVAFRLQAARRLIPYLKLVERERLRVPLKSKQAYFDFFESDAVNQLFTESISDKLAISQIMMLLGEKPLSTSEIADKLGLNPSDVSRHMITSSRHGLVRYDTANNCYTLI